MVARVAADQEQCHPNWGIRVMEATLEVETYVVNRTGKQAVVVLAQEARARTQWMAPVHTGAREPQVVTAVTA
jgi:hypothetical protein